MVKDGWLRRESGWWGRMLVKVVNDGSYSDLSDKMLPLIVDRMVK